MIAQTNPLEQGLNTPENYGSHGIIERENHDMNQHFVGAQNQRSVIANSIPVDMRLEALNTAIYAAAVRCVIPFKVGRFAGVVR